jgi:hypothetical protein
MNALAVKEFLSQHLDGSGISLGDLANNGGAGEEKLLELVMGGRAKLPLDRVMSVSAFTGCDPQQLFRASLEQFYSTEVVELFVKMLGPAVTAEEQEWLEVIRSASRGQVNPPSRLSRNLIRAAVSGQEI